MTTRLTAYAPFPVSFSHGQGVMLWDTEGNEYLDALCGIAVTGLGHNHPAVTATLHEQASKLLHTSNLFHIPAQEQLADTLCRLSGASQAFFCNSGAEANETAIKIARLYGHQKGIETPQIIVMDKAFHGRTMATLTASSNPKAQIGFEPLLPGFIRCPYNDLDALAELTTSRKDITAIMLEPIQGEGGVHVPSPGYLRGVRDLCDQHEVLMIADEVQTGMGRTGKWFGFQHDNGALPELITLAKGLGNGVPIGACLIHGNATNLLKPGLHGSTFGGNPLVCQVAQTVINVIETHKLVDHAKKIGQILHKKIDSATSEIGSVVTLRGKGLMIGIELNRPCRSLIQVALQQGLVIGVTANNVVRLLPPLIIEPTHIEWIESRLKTAIELFHLSALSA